MLRSFSSDCTPIKTSMAVRFRVVARFGFKCCEFLMRVCFYRYHTDLGGTEDAVVLGNPVPLTNGKSVDAQFTAGLTLSSSLREMGHEGIAIEHTSFDRCGLPSSL